ncbi:hypothetical protein AAU61_14210 [Desulfocarbo indianensis]|nr:hypothetical protein AAU61_14210 [Desulfocarbo indianensis]
MYKKTILIVTISMFFLLIMACGQGSGPSDAELESKTGQLLSNQYKEDVAKLKAVSTEYWSAAKSAINAAGESKSNAMFQQMQRSSQLMERLSFQAKQLVLMVATDIEKETDYKITTDEKKLKVIYRKILGTVDEKLLTFVPKDDDKK